MELFDYLVGNFPTETGKKMPANVSHDVGGCFARLKPPDLKEKSVTGDKSMFDSRMPNKQKEKIISQIAAHWQDFFHQNSETSLI